MDSFHSVKDIRMYTQADSDILFQYSQKEGNNVYLHDGSLVLAKHCNPAERPLSRQSILHSHDMSIPTCYKHNINAIVAKPKAD